MNLTGLTSLVGAIGVIVVAILQFLERKPAASVKATVEATQANVQTGVELVGAVHEEVKTINGTGTLSEQVDRADKRQATDDAGTTSQPPTGKNP